MLNEQVITRASLALMASVVLRSFESNASLMSLINCFSDYSLKKTEVDTDMSESFALLWRGKTAYAYINVLGDGRLHYYFEPEIGSPEEAIVDKVVSLPEGVLKTINQAVLMR